MFVTSQTDAAPPLPRLEAGHMLAKCASRFATLSTSREDSQEPDIAGDMMVEGPARVDVPVATPLDQLASVHYAELLRIARRELRRAGNVATLDTRAVLHETFLRLVTQQRTSWSDRPLFLAAAAGMMRRVLIDHLRRRRTEKRGRAQTPVTLDDGINGQSERDADLVALDDALDELAQFAPRLAQVVECRYFGGLTELETAEALGITERTVRRDWVKARGWLHGALRDLPMSIA
ncbi:MAG TPA: ECF-type sigma factor [Gemmatimonas sp.]|uniref:ECF-type sigma factor n=1 Tax=Gemmatimonas sp. TaxID=1962908 RepID=UPI002ED91A9F